MSMGYMNGYSGTFGMPPKICQVFLAHDFFKRAILGGDRQSPRFISYPSLTLPKIRNPNKDYQLPSPNDTLFSSLQNYETQKKSMGKKTHDACLEDHPSW